MSGNVVILDGVPHANYFGVGQGWDGSKHFELNIGREARIGALNVDLVRVPSLGLEEELVSGLVGKTHNLCLDRRAVPGTRCRDLSIEHRGTV